MIYIRALWRTYSQALMAKVGIYQALKVRMGLNQDLVSGLIPGQNGIYQGSGVALTAKNGFLSGLLGGNNPRHIGQNGYIPGLCGGYDPIWTQSQNGYTSGLGGGAKLWHPKLEWTLIFAQYCKT